MSARDQILSKIRTLNSSNISRDERKAVIDERITKHPKGVIPKLSDKRLALVKRFKAKVIAAAGSCQSCGEDQLAMVVTKYLRDHNLPARIRIGSDKRLKGFKSKSAGMVEILEGPSDGNDLACLSHSIGGVAETGTVFMASGKQNPTTLNFLPEHHLVVVRESNITGSYEDLIAKVRKKYGSGKMPRTLNMITGPSRSGDIEQKLILGAHGPLALHVIIVKD